MDEQAVIDSEPHLERFLREILAKSDAEKIYLVAHSMGNRVLTRALVNIAISNPEGAGRIKRIILAAPDISTREFTQQIAPAVFKLRAPITLYASSNDEALRHPRNGMVVVLARVNPVRT
ncbi:alpha/beta hydrolase [Caballeronia sp. S22]|uniref:alpha/beta hydrolase n=1 Tax=Caballeronia sp. S22 TaxID=3137182 RepID=UPI003530F55B